MNGTTGTPSPTRGTADTPRHPKLDPIFVSVEEAGAAICLSRREVYRLLDDNELESVERGRRRLVVVESLLAYAARLRRQAAERRAASAGG